MIFANVTSGTKEQNQAVINSGAVLSFIQLMDAESINLSEQVLSFQTHKEIRLRLSFVWETLHARMPLIEKSFMKTGGFMLS